MGSSGGIFTLVTQDDITDAYFTAMNILVNRFKEAKYSGTTVDTSFVEETHILNIKAKYDPYIPIASEYMSAGSKTFNLDASNKTVAFTIPTYGDFINDCCLHVRFKAMGNKALYDENIDPTEENPLYRYCAYPGIRLLQNVAFTSDGSYTIDEYTPDDVIAYKNFFVKQDHKAGWGRCYGQDEIQQATYNSKSYTGILNYQNGYQTPKLYQQAFDMFIPLRFWFCEGPESALLVEKTTTTQRTIRFTFAKLQEIIQTLIYNVDEGIPPNITQIGTAQVPLPMSSVSVTATLYVNYLFTYTKIMEIIRNDSNISLVRVHKRQVTGLPSAANFTLLNNLHYAGEFMAVGFRNRNNINDFDRWHLMGSDFISADANHSKTLHVPTIIWNTDLSIRQLVTREAIQATSMNNLVDTMGVVLYGGITLYPTLPYNFFNDYLPIKYSKNSAVISPYDNNMFLLTFCIWPGKQNMSGYINFSTSREVYINYSLNEEFSSIATDCEMVVCMSAVNFLIRENDSIRLKNAI